MPTTPNPPAFEAAVRAYLDDARDQFNYDQLLHTFLSPDRFRAWAKVVDRYHPVAGARFLSSGCGFAGSLLAYRDVGAKVAVGVEVDEDYLRFGDLRTQALAGAGVVCYDGWRLPFGDATFDVIESMDVIEHTEDPVTYLAELKRVLAPDGVILLVTPNRLWPVEQHLGILGPPWLPIALADRLFATAAKFPALDDDRRFRYAKLAGMRTQNVSFRRLRMWAKRLRLRLHVLRPEEHAGHWPLPRQRGWVERLADHRVGKFVAPVRTLAVLLEPGG